MKNILQILSFSLLIVLSACTEDASIAGSFNESQSGTSGSITRFAILNDFMYTLNPNQLQTFDISDADNPVLLSELETDYGLETIFIYEDRIYLGSRVGLFILGLDDPAQPNLLSQTPREEEFFGSCDPVVVKDTYAYSTVKTVVNICGTVNTQSALLVYEVSDPENPIQTQAFQLSQPNGLAFTDKFLYVCDTGSEELLVFDISNPAEVELRRDLSYALLDPFDIIVDDDRMIVSTINDFVILSLDEDGGITFVKNIAK